MVYPQYGISFLAHKFSLSIDL
ncbi:hypothetical protein VCRA2114E121_60100 [Vibrio crassostreae]|nr:hypothetical protein VCRA2114E121_60100 [Vibrio crassostreae]CAK3061230.1 hypothetical protein VCRA217O111_60099 [Vibrio crassostreae]